MASERDGAQSPQFTVCNCCGSKWDTGEAIYWERDTCGFCGSDDLEYNRGDTDDGQ